MTRRMMGNCFVVLVLIIFAPKSQKANGQTPDRISPKALAVLEDVAASLKKATSLSVEIEMTMDVDGQGVSQHYETRHQLLAHKPDKLALVSSDSLLAHTVICNGSNYYQHDPMTGEAGTMERTGKSDLNNLRLTYLAPAMPQEDIAIAYVSAIVSTDPVSKMYASDGELTYVDVEEVEDMDCHKLKVALSGKGGWDPGPAHIKFLSQQALP